MFERRLKIILAVLFAFTFVLVLRAAQLQVVQRDDWRVQAAKTMRQEELIESSRGRILDFKGREIAVDQACEDACVDYRVIISPPDEKFVSEFARQRFNLKYPDGFSDKTERKKALDHEIELVNTDIEIMWATLAKVGGMSRQEIEETRQAIIRRVDMRRRYLWYARFDLARDAFNKRAPSAWWKQWLIDDTQKAPNLDTYLPEPVAEEREPHVVLRNISQEIMNLLWKDLDKYPGLVLQPSTTRVYPFAEIGCHVVGSLSKVNDKDLQNDPDLGDGLRKYYDNDLIGRTGLEALCEPLLRGTRGRMEFDLVDKQRTRTLEPEPGADVHTTIDMQLEKDITDAFQHVKMDGASEPIAMHGAAVVLDIKTNQVRAMVSNPGFDPNKLSENYAAMMLDQLNKPMMNRATQFALEPGSTVKPMVGISAVTQGVIGLNEGIECTGYLKIGGRVYQFGRCWTASKFAKSGVAFAHHQIPTQDPHHGHDGNADGFLTLTDAIERSCNVYFETVANRLGMEDLSDWMERFGLGRPTGVGIKEVAGRIPGEFVGSRTEQQHTTWFAGIGQGDVNATPIQMANIAATIARNGIWMRPRLVVEDVPRYKNDPNPDRVDLHVSPAAVAAARQGMINVVNTDAGTGNDLKVPGLLVAGKTGTAQAAVFTIVECDEKGKAILDENGNKIIHRIDPNTPDHSNPDAPWYRGSGADHTSLNHAWFIGFAPAHNPQIAFAVLLEYGGSGGHAAAPVADALLEACIAHGYLARDNN
jgi:penicillin-binding protein 2